MTGIVFKELGWRNFQSYGNNLNVISLDFTKPTAIIGRNLDSSVEGNIDSNGAGKSTILNALSYVLYDKTVSDIKKDKLINWINEKNMEVYVIFQKDNLFYKIERFRKFSKKGGDGVKVLVSNTGDFTDESKFKDETRDSVNRANKQIVEILGTPFDVFTRVVLLSSNTPSFFTLPTTSANDKTCQQDILEELFGYTEISEKSDILKENISKDKKELDTLIQLNTQLSEEAERLKSQILFSKTQFDDWIISNKNEIVSLQQIIKKLSEIDYDEERLIFEQLKKIDTKIQEKLPIIREKEFLIDNQNKSKTAHTQWENNQAEAISKIKKDIERYSNIDFDSQLNLFNEIDELIIKKDAVERKIYDYLKLIKELENNIKDKEKELEHLADNKCPYCLQDYKDVKIKINEINTFLKEKTKYLSQIKESNKKCETSNIELRLEIEDKKKSLVFTTKTITISSKAEAASLSSKLEERLQETNPHVISEINVDVSEIDTLKSEIAGLKATIDKFKCVQKFQSERDLLNSESELVANQKLLTACKSKKNPHAAILQKLKETELPKDKNPEIESLRDDIEHSEFLYKLLTKKDSFIRKALLNKNLPFLNERLRLHLNKSGLPHKVTFTENMTAGISQFGTQIDYANLSTGQKARLDLATSFAFRDVLQTRHSKINLCMLDEYLDSGLSGVGVVMAIKMIKEIARDEKIPIFIISHNEAVAGLFDSKIEVELNNKFSNIVRSDIKFSTSSQ